MPTASSARFIIWKLATTPMAVTAAQRGQDAPTGAIGADAIPLHHRRRQIAQIAAESNTEVDTGICQSP